MVLKAVVFERARRIKLARDKDQWRALVNIVMNVGFP
jgi:hypothetical protein